MGLGIEPGVRVEGPGEKTINSRLLRWARQDLSGTKSDTLTLLVSTEDKPGLPKEGAKLKWFEGYDDDLADKGEFLITMITPTMYPPSVKIVATAAPWQVDDKSGFKERRSRTFEGKTLGEIFREVVGKHGFTPRISPSLDTVKIPHEDQNNETDSAFLIRLAKAQNAVAKPVGSLYIFAEKGQTKKMSGQPIKPYIVNIPSVNNPSAPGFIGCTQQKNSRASVKGVRATWTNDESGEEGQVKVGSSPYKRLRQSFYSEEKAKEACNAELKQVRRQANKLHLNLPGDPHVVAEGLLSFSGEVPEHMEGEWTIESVKASDSVSVYRCDVVLSAII